MLLFLKQICRFFCREFVPTIFREGPKFTKKNVGIFRAPSLKRTIRAPDIQRAPDS